MSDRNWFRAERWDDEIAAAFEQRLGRARSHNRAQYVRIQGVHLSRTDDPAYRKVGRDLFRRVLEQYDDDDGEVKGALQCLGASCAQDGLLDEAEQAYRKLLALIAVSPTGSSGTDGVAELHLAGLLVRRGGRRRLIEADGLLDAVEGEVRAQASFLNHVVDFLTARARVSDGLGRSVERREYARAAAGTASTRSAVASAGSSGADMTVGRIG